LHDTLLLFYKIIFSYHKTMNKKGYVGNIETLSKENTDFRHVLYTAQNVQLVLMSLKPGEDIGEEMHELDQFLRIESGVGEALVGDTTYPVEDGVSVLVPAGTNHNIINTSTTDDLKLYTLYAPPEHQDGTIRHTKAEAEANEEHYDAKPSE